jgi:hypothetical protein
MNVTKFYKPLVDILTNMETKTICEVSQEQNQAHLFTDLRFKDIAPKWAARLGPEEEFPIFLSSTWFKWFRELKYTSKCVVGEAYGNSSKYVYNCDECGNIGFKFMQYFMLNWHRKLEHNKERFVKHWNENHREENQLLSVANTDDDTINKTNNPVNISCPLQ